MKGMNPKRKVGTEKGAPFVDHLPPKIVDFPQNRKTIEIETTIGVSQRTIGLASYNDTPMLLLAPS